MKEIRFNAYLLRQLTTLRLDKTYLAFEVFKRRFVDSLYNVVEGGNTSAYIASRNGVTENYVRGHLKVMFAREWVKWVDGGLLFRSVPELLVLEGTMLFIKEQHGVVHTNRGYDKALVGGKALVRGGKGGHYMQEQVYSNEGPYIIGDKPDRWVERRPTVERSASLFRSMRPLEGYSAELIKTFLPSVVIERDSFVNKAYEDRKVNLIRKSRRIYREGFYRASVEVLDRKGMRTAFESVMLSHKVYCMSVANITVANRPRRPLVDSKGASVKANLLNCEVLSGSDVVRKGFSQGAVSLARVFCCTPSKALRVMRKFEKAGLLETTRETKVLAGGSSSPEHRSSLDGSNSSRYLYKGKVYERKVNMYTVGDLLKKTSLSPCKQVSSSPKEKVSMQHVCYTL